MSTPNVLHVTWNAADAINAGIRNLPGEDVDPADITRALAQKIGRAFVLCVRSERPAMSCAVRLVSMLDEDTFSVRSIDEPPLEDIVQVASVPPPRMSVPHGDCKFDLVSVLFESSSSGQS